MVGSLNSRPSSTHKLFDAIERTSLVAAIIGVGLTATFQQTLSVASIPFASFAFFSQVNRRRLEELVQQNNSTSEGNLFQIQQELKQLKEQINTSTVETRLSSLESAQEKLTSLSNVIPQLQEKIHFLELASQQYATQSQVKDLHSNITTNQNKVNLRIQKIQKKIQEISQTKSNDIQVWLRSKNIVVIESCSAKDRTSNFNSIVKTLGDKYSKLAPLYQQIKRSLHTQEQVQFDLSKTSNQDIVYFTSFCHQLKEATLISDYQYDKSRRIIHFTLPKEGNKINFLTGGWFEEFVYQKVINLLNSRKLKFQALKNPEIQFPDNNKYELDLLFTIKNKPLWIECKTGAYSDDIPRYSQHRELLSISKESSLVVALGISDLQAEQETNKCDLTIVNEQNFLNKLERLLLNF